MAGKNIVLMKRKYLITLDGPDCTQTTRELDSDQYELVSGIISDLWCERKSAVTPFLKISEIPIRVIDKVKVLGRGYILVCTDAECLEIGQKIKADFSGTIFEVTALERLSHVSTVGVVLRPNDMVFEVPLGAVLEVLS